MLANRRVKWFSDSQVCAHVVKVGSSKLDLHDLAINCLRICLVCKIDVDIQWTPRKLTGLADDIGRYRNSNETKVPKNFSPT